MLDEEGVRGAEVAVTFVGERRMRDLNREHRGKDEVTDVLSFPLEDWEAGDPTTTERRRPSWSPRPHPTSARWRRRSSPARPDRLCCSATSSICARRALEQARGDDLPPSLEMAVLLAHGTLHLLGHDHETDAGQMALRQAEVLELVDWEGLVVAPPR